MAYGASMKRLNPCGDAEILALLGGYCPALQRLLDAGCGRGDRLAAIRAALPGAALYGLDADGENAAAARAVCPGAEISVGDICALPYGDRAFDAALCECTLSLTAEPARCLRELFRVLRPGGVLLLGDLCAPGDAVPLALEGDGLQTLFFKDWLEAAAAAAGFRLLAYQDCREALLTMAAQMIFDGSYCDCVGAAGAAALKKHKAGYGLWVLKKEVESW